MTSEESREMRAIDERSSNSHSDAGSRYTNYKENSRPPVYNAEDYGTFLKKWTKPGNISQINQTSDFQGEMSLRQFSNISDLLHKLKNDLRLSYSSFVQEFVVDPIDGITLLLELMRRIQLNQGNTDGKTKTLPSAQRRSQIDEHSCLLCLKYCLRCHDAARRMAVSPSGLFTIAVCIMSSVNKSRIVSLELLTSICDQGGDVGHSAVSEAMSTMRLRFGEPARFRFLVSMMGSASPDLLLSGLRFINTILQSAPKRQSQLYLQAELQQAQFDVNSIKKALTKNEPLNDYIMEELHKFEDYYIDVENLERKYEEKCKQLLSLQQKVSQLQAKIEELTLGRSCTREKETAAVLKKHCMEVEYALRCYANMDGEGKTAAQIPKREGNSTPAEDEGISSSDQDDCCGEGGKHQVEGGNADDSLKPVVINGTKIALSIRSSEDSYSDTAAPCSKSFLDDGEDEEETDIVPCKILPEPPKKSKSLLFLRKDHFEINPFFEDDESVDGSTPPFPLPEYRPPQRTGLPQKSKYDRPLKRSETFHDIHMNETPAGNVSRFKHALESYKTGVCRNNSSAGINSAKFIGYDDDDDGRDNIRRKTSLTAVSESANRGDEQNDEFYCDKQKREGDNFSLRIHSQLRCIATSASRDFTASSTHLRNITSNGTNCKSIMDLPSGLY